MSIRTTAISQSPSSVHQQSIESKRQTPSRGVVTTKTIEPVQNRKVLPPTPMEWAAMGFLAVGIVRIFQAVMDQALRKQAASGSKPV